MWASRYEHSATVKLLLDKGAKMDIADKVCHVICLQYVMTDHMIGRNQASEYKCVHPITCTLSFWSNLLSKHISSHQDGCTALMWAARRSSAATVTLLLDKGALINNVDKVWNSVYVLRVYMQHVSVRACIHLLCTAHWRAFCDACFPTISPYPVAYMITLGRMHGTYVGITA